MHYFFNILKRNILFIFLFALSLIAVFSLFHAGFPLTHDGDVHLVRLTDFHQSLQEGILIPRWGGHVNYGYGQPTFEFFYPLPLYIGSLFHFFHLTFADSIKLILILSLVLSGMSMYAWLNAVYGKVAAFVGGVLYMFAPFRLVDIYVRGDIGESLGFVFVPLILLFSYRLFQKKSPLSVAVIGISLGLLIICHNILSIMFLPIILGYGGYLFFSAKEYNKNFVIFFLLSIALGFGLASFFWIPGIFEAKFTLRDILTRGGYVDRFVSFQSLLFGPWSYGGTGQFTVQIGILQWIAVLVSFFSLPILYKRSKKICIFVILLLVCLLISIFFMLPISNGIWQRIALLQAFQFPWRFLSLTVFVGATAGGILGTYIPKRFLPFSVSLFIVLVLLINKDYLHAKGFVSRPDTYFSGNITTPADTGESSPIWSVRSMDKVYASPIQVISGNAFSVTERHLSTHHRYYTYAFAPSEMVENTLYFPGWEVLVDGKQVPVEFQNPLYRGLMTFSLPQGKHTIDVVFVHTKMRLVAEFISLFFLICVCAVIVLSIRDRITHKRYEK